MFSKNIRFICNRSLQSTLLFSSLLSAPALYADILITEVLPGVTTSEIRGDTVELYNSGVSAVDLTDWVLTDLDPASVESDLSTEGTFAPVSLSLPSLQPGDYAVIVFSDSGSSIASYIDTNYGLKIYAPLATPASSFLADDFEQLLLIDDSDNAIDFVAWSITDGVPSNTTDTYEDLQALTPPTAAYVGAQGNAAWDAPDSIIDTATYRSNTVDFTDYDNPSTYGNGSIRRISTGETFSVGSPDGPSNFEAVPNYRVSLGNPSDDVTTLDGFRPIRYTDDIAEWLSSIDQSNFPDRRIARDADQNPADFVTPSGGDLTAWEALLVKAMAGQWEETFDDATALGYEVIEFLDTVTGKTFYILRERVAPGEAGFTGMGVYIFYEGLDGREYLTIQVPHPRFDSNTLDQGAMTVQQVLPRVTMIAGTHRNNHLTDSSCDGTFSGGDSYRISDVAHHPDNFFHQTHLYLNDNLTDFMAIQYHGFCCPGVAPYDSLTDDVIVSNGYNASPGVEDFTQLWRTEIDDQAFSADDGMGGDTTTAAVYGDDAFVLGATTNLQGRYTNGIAEADVCDTAAASSTGRFIHIEQDPDVREEPQHILDALDLALDALEALPVELDRFVVE